MTVWSQSFLCWNIADPTCCCSASFPCKYCWKLFELSSSFIMVIGIRSYLLLSTLVLYRTQINGTAGESCSLANQLNCATKSCLTLPFKTPGPWYSEWIQPHDIVMVLDAQIIPGWFISFSFTNHCMWGLDIAHTNSFHVPTAFFADLNKVKLFEWCIFGYQATLQELGHWEYLGIIVLSCMPFW